MRSIIAMFIGIGSTLLFHYFISVPILPAVSIFLTALLFVAKDRHMIMRMVCIIVSTIFALLLYLTNAISMIVFYPQYGNVFGVVMEFLTAFACVVSGILMSISAIKAHKIQKYSRI